MVSQGKDFTEQVISEDPFTKDLDFRVSTETASVQ